MLLQNPLRCVHPILQLQYVWQRPQKHLGKGVCSPLWERYQYRHNPIGWVVHFLENTGAGDLNHQWLLWQTLPWSYLHVGRSWPFFGCRECQRSLSSFFYHRPSPHHAQDRRWYHRQVAWFCFADCQIGFRPIALGSFCLVFVRDLAAQHPPKRACLH